MAMQKFNSIAALQGELRRFADERDWNQFHSPKNLAMALIAEAGELVEHFQWLSQEESHSIKPNKLAAVASEMADVFIYLARLADVLDVDLLAAASQKIEENQEKYPESLARGRADKYTDL